MRFLLAFLLPVLAAAAPAKLVATAAGDALYFELQAGVLRTAWYRLDVATGQVTRATSSGPTQLEVSADGLTFSTSSNWRKLCYWPGSSCITTVAPNCRASTTLGGPASGDWRYDGRDSLVRLSADGTLAWMEPASHGCGVYTIIPPPALYGLFDTRSKTVIAGGEGYTLANRTPGRRMFTSDGRVLVRSMLSGGLVLLDAQQRATPAGMSIPATAEDPVMDDSGCVIAYRSQASFFIADCGANPASKPLYFEGSLAAMTPDGRFLVFRNVRNDLSVYDRTTGVAVSNLLDSPVESLTLGGGYVFAAVADGRILRMALDNGAVETLLPAIPEIEDVQLERPRIESVYQTPAFYGAPEPAFRARPGTVVLVRFRNPEAAAGWRARFEPNGERANLTRWPGSPDRHWFQVPYGPFQGAVLSHPDRPAIEILLSVVPDSWPYSSNASFVRCLGVFPLSGGRQWRAILTGLPVSSDPPPAWMVPYVENARLEPDTPFALADEGAGRVDHFGPLAGSVGLQAFDFTLLRPFTGESLFAGDKPPVGCVVPPF